MFFFDGIRFEGSSRVLLFKAYFICGNILWKRSLGEKTKQKRRTRNYQWTESRWCVTVPSIGEVGRSPWKLDEEMQTHPSAAKQHFLKHRSSSWTKRGSILRTLLLTVRDLDSSRLFFVLIHLFFYALEQHALPPPPEQYFTLVSQSAAEKSLLLYKDLPIYLE